MAVKKKRSIVVAEKITKTGKSIKTQMGSFLSDKPIWAWWIAYTVAIGILFLIFFAALKMLTGIWWVTILLIIVIGFIWGTLNFNKHKEQSGTGSMVRKPSEKKKTSRK